MSIRNKSKDHLKKHAGVVLVAPIEPPQSDDPLKFRTGHPTESTLVNLHVFADGAVKISNSNGKRRWSGNFTGRPELILELAPAIQARLLLTSKATCSNYLKALRMFWRTCDKLESIQTLDGQSSVGYLKTVRDLTPLHEAAMHRDKFGRNEFGIIKNLCDDTRRILKLRPLMWASPKDPEPNRQLIPDAHAKELKFGIKRDWERVRNTWERHDAIRGGLEPDTLNEYQKQYPAVVEEYAAQNNKLRKNWAHFVRIQTSTGKLNPTGQELLDGRSKHFYFKRDLHWSVMRAIAFPTMEDAHVAFHASLMRSGWNPSTLITGFDATLPSSIFQHPKDEKQNVLSIEAETEADDQGEAIEEVSMQGSKRRAGGRMQFCMGLKKDPDSPPNIVASFLARTQTLRAQLHRDVNEAQAIYEQLRAQDAPQEDIETQFTRLQTLQQGTRNIWLYVDRQGAINWIDGIQWKAFYSPGTATNAKSTISYLELLTNRLNSQREKRGDDPIAAVKPSDFRDIYARWVYRQSGGNILAVMIALGHSRLKSTGGYLDNNIFSSENDEAIRKFTTSLFNELSIGRLDLTILAQLVRHGSMTDEMLARLTDYRSLSRSRVKVACADIRNPPLSVDPGHAEGKRCRTHRCLNECPHAHFLPESLDGIAMRVEELMVISDHMSIDAWGKDGFDKELAAGEYLLAELFAPEEVNQIRMHWREKISAGKHVIPGVGIVHQLGVA